MTLLIDFLGLLVIHWVWDFVLQSHWMASNKSKRLDALSMHVAFYTAGLFLYGVVVFDDRPGRFALVLGWVLLNAVLHFITDYITSRITSRLFMAQFEEGVYSPFSGDRVAMRSGFTLHNFFVVVGVDQLIHQLTLGITMMWMFS